MNKLIKTIFVISLLILSLDGIVLTSLSGLWKKTIESVQHKPFKAKMHYAIGSYILMIFGLYYFVYKHINQNSWIFDTLIKGFLFGFTLYGVFDFTNLAIFSDYALHTAIIDMFWGGTLMGITSFLSYYLLEIYNL
jgi:uncharacterized membrane protein